MSQLEIEDQGREGPHIHRGLVPIRQGGDGPRIAQLCPGCSKLFHPVTGRPLRPGTRGWQRALEEMHDILTAQAREPGPLGRLARQVRGVL